MTYKAKVQATADGKDISGTSTAEVFGFNRAENGSARFILKPRRSRRSGQDQTAALLDAGSSRGASAGEKCEAD